MSSAISISNLVKHYDDVVAAYPDLEDRRLIYEVIRRMIGHVVTDLIVNTAGNIEVAGIETIDDARSRDRPLVVFSDEVYEAHTGLKQFLRRNLYRHKKVRAMNERTRAMVEELFSFYMADTSRMPPWFETQADGNEQRRARVVADYIAGMTDRFAIAEHERLS